MAEGRVRLGWNQTSLLASLIYNSNVTNAADAKSSEDFHPYMRLRRRGDELPGNDITVLKALLPQPDEL